MMTEANVKAASAVLAQLRSWKAASEEVGKLVQGNLYGANGVGLKMKMSDRIVGIVKRERLADIDKAMAHLRREAAQLSLVLPDDLR
jgi:hypothetical protein